MQKCAYVCACFHVCIRLWVNCRGVTVKTLHLQRLTADPDLCTLSLTHMPLYALSTHSSFWISPEALPGPGFHICKVGTHTHIVLSSLPLQRLCVPVFRQENGIVQSSAFREPKGCPSSSAPTVCDAVLCQPSLKSFQTPFFQSQQPSGLMGFFTSSMLSTSLASILFNFFISLGFICFVYLSPPRFSFFFTVFVCQQGCLQYFTCHLCTDWFSLGGIWVMFSGAHHN